MDDVTEEHSQGGQDQPDAEREHEEHGNEPREQEHVPGWCDLEEDHNRDDRDEGYAEVHECEHDLLKREDDLVDTDLLDERGGVDNGGHGR